MNSDAKSTRMAVVVMAFSCGLSGALLSPFERTDIRHDFPVHFQERSLGLAMAAVLTAAATAVTISVILRLLRHRSRLERVMLKLFVIALPAVAAGELMALVLGFVGISQTPVRALLPIVLGSAAGFSAGLVGIRLLQGMPEYAEIERPKTLAQDEATREQIECDSP